MKKRFLVLIFLLLSLVSVFASATTLVPYKKSDGTTLKHRGSTEEVMIPDEYIEKGTDFRAVWVSHLVNDFPSYQNAEQYKAEVQKVLDTMEYFNMNAMIFHVRTHNNALYKSALNPVASYYRNADFDVFDPLEYIIEEAHARGIEFHAWMNPYRVSTTYTGTVESYAATQPAYNIASKPEMLLKVNNNLILNPGEPMVRDFIVDTVMEVIENYDVDAIHFDDYFYIGGEDDTITRTKYNQEGLSVENFRRKQVDLFIEQLHTSMKEYNLENNRVVQLGISPSGIYRNGGYVPLEDYIYDENGKLTYPEYSSSQGFSHYDAYLFSDTKKWIDEAWIDYILPQTYWSFEQPVAGFADLMDWWNMVVKHSDVNLYSGMGLYMAIGTGSYGWLTNEDEALNQVIYSSNLDNVRGHSIYSYKHIKRTYDNATRDILTKGFTKVKELAWTDYKFLPEIRTYDSVILPSVENFKVQKVDGKNVVSFDKLEGAKFYILYRDETNVTYDDDQIIDIFGSKEELVTYIDDTNQNYEYGIRSMSNSNTLGNGTTSEITEAVYDISFYADDVLVAKYKSNETFTLPEIPAKIGYDKVSPTWSVTDFSNVRENTTVVANYTVNVYVIDFYNQEGEVFHTVALEHGDVVTAPNPPSVDGYKFKAWDIDFSSVTSDLEVKAIYEKLVEDKPNVFSCKEINFSFMMFSLGFALFLIIRRKK